MSLRIKLLLPFVIFLVCSLLFLQFVWLPTYMKYEEKDLQRQEQSYLELLSTALLPDLLTGDLAKIHNTLDSIVQERDYWHSIILTNAAGVRLYPLETEADEPNTESMITSSYILNFQENRVAEIKAIMHFDELIGKKVRRIRMVELSLIGIIAIMAFIIIFFQDISIRRPLARLADASVQIAAGSYDAVLPPPSADEIGRFSRAFDKMRQTLKTRESELTRSRKRLASIIDNSVDAIINIDTKGIILSVNKAVETIFGYRQEELLDRNISIIMPEPYRHEHDGYIKKYLETGQSHIIGIGREVIGAHKNGSTIELYLAVSEVHVENQIIFTGLIRDISLQKKAEESLKQAKEEAEHANRAKSVFLANMSHEIRTPLNAVLGFSELLSTMVTGEKEISYLDSIRSSGKGLLTIINDILDLSKIEAGKLDFNYESIDLERLLREIQQIFIPTIRQKGIKIIVEPASEFSTGLILDEIRIRQVLINLVGNAVKFTHKGEVKISAKMKKGEAPGKNNLSISVSDTGIGIPKAQQDMIFKAFQQQETHTAKLYGGTGLGLTISERLVKMMNGKIYLESQEGNGSKFTVILSDVKSDNKLTIMSEEKNGIDLPEIDFDPASILVVDDVASNRELIKAMLVDTRIRLLEADSGEKALMIIQREKPDLVLLDIRMPGMNGFEVLKQIRRDINTRNIKVIVITASINFESSIQTDFSDFDGLLYKPVSVRDIIQELCRFLPYEIAQETKSNDHSRALPDNTKKISNLPTLIKLIETDIYTEWKKFKGVLEMDELSKFADHLIEIGKKHDAQVILWYAQKINSAIERFEIDTINDLMDQFPAVIDSIKKISS
jgi:PAS domain S-box-containing protein